MTQNSEPLMWSWLWTHQFSIFTWHSALWSLLFLFLVSQHGCSFKYQFCTVHQALLLCQKTRRNSHILIIQLWKYLIIITDYYSIQPTLLQGCVCVFVCVCNHLVGGWVWTVCCMHTVCLFLLNVTILLLLLIMYRTTNPYTFLRIQHYKITGINESEI